VSGCCLTSAAFNYGHTTRVFSVRLWGYLQSELNGKVLSLTKDTHEENDMQTG
jgi:hypothetical protein